MKKKIKKFTQKETTPSIKPVKINNDTTCVFIIYENGAFKAKLEKNEAPPQCKIRTVLSSTCLKYYISDDGKPIGFTGNWKNLSNRAKIEANLAFTAGNKKYTYEIIN